MNNFERGLEPKESMGIGVDALLKELGVKFAHTQLGEPVFIKEEDRDMILRPLDWNSQQLRAIADYLDAHPESTKVIDIINDHSPRVLNPTAPADIDLDSLDIPFGMPWTTPPLPPSKFGNI
jgi:hypothetical protein